MSYTNPDSPPEQCPPPEIPNVSQQEALHGPEGPFFNPQNDGRYDDLQLEADLDIPRQEPWPDQTFDFGRNRLVGSELLGITVNRTTRLRGVVEAVTVNISNKTALQMADESPGLSLQAMRDFLVKPIPRTEQTYGSLLQIEAALATVEAVLAHENNPVWQALQQLRSEYGERLGPEVMAEIVQDTLMSTQCLRLVRLYHPELRNRPTEA